MPSLSLVRDGTHPLAVGPVNPGLLHRPGRSDRLRRWVPGNPGTRPTDRLARQHVGVSRIGGQAGTQETSDPTPTPSQTRGSRAGSTIHSLPAEYALAPLASPPGLGWHRSIGSVAGWTCASSGLPDGWPPRRSGIQPSMLI